MLAPKGLGEELRALRVLRRLSLGDAAIRAGLSKSALMGWESERSRPRGPGLMRLLDALEADPRLRARLLHAADPGHARFALTETPLGAPVDVGKVIRAMRLRRGVTQAALARMVGIVQSAVARWESGEAVPSGETLHAAAFAMGASPEEAVALACAEGVPSGRLPGAPFGSLEDLDRTLCIPGGALREVVLLGLEAELWPRAVRDDRWDDVLANVTGLRAVQLFCDGRLGEAEGAALRALRLAPGPSGRLAATHAFSALLEVATERGADPGLLAERIGAWAARLPDGMVKGWMHWEQALRFAEVGRHDQAADLNERMVEQYAVASSLRRADIVNLRSGSLLEIEIRAGRGDRAEEAFERLQVDVPYPARTRVRIAHTRGEAADEATLQAMREEPFPHIDRQGDDAWYGREKLAKVEREQARLTTSA